MASESVWLLLPQKGAWRLCFESLAPRLFLADLELQESQRDPGVGIVGIHLNYFH